MASEEYGSPSSIQVASSNLQVSLERIRSLASGGQVEESVENFRSLVERKHAGLIAFSTSAKNEPAIRTWQTIQAAANREFCLAASANSALLQAYRQQVDSEVSTLYKQAVADSNVDVLAQIVGQFRWSSVAEDALLLLGEIAFQRGELRTARACWAEILWEFDGDHEPNRESARLPSSATSEALARLCLLSIIEGDVTRAQHEFAKLEHVAPDREGILAGRRGKYVPILRQQLENAVTPHSHRPVLEWSAYGGSNSRCRDIPSIGRIGSPLWHLPWSYTDPKRTNPKYGLREYVPAATGAEAGQLPYPLVHAERIIVAPVDTLQAVMSVDFSGVTKNGSKDSSRLLDGQRDHHGLATEKWIPLSRSPNSTLAISSDSILYAKLSLESDDVDPSLAAAAPFGAAPFGAGASLGAGASKGRSPPRLFAVDLTAQKKLLFEIELTRPNWEGLWRFDGGPLVQGSHLYAIVKRHSGVRYESHMAKFDRRTGRLIWRQFVSSNSASQTGEENVVHQHLLSYADGTVFVNSNDGVVAAIEAQTGEPRWVAQYPRVRSGALPIDRSDAFRRRQLNPCLIVRDQVIVAPRDSDQLFSFDFATGSLRWSTPPELVPDATYLLGNQANTLIATGDVAYWINLEDGQLVAQFPQVGKRGRGHAKPNPIGAGRGVVTPTEFIWPTRSELIVFSPLSSQGVPVRQRFDLTAHGLSGGHLVPAKDMLVLAGPQGLTTLQYEGHSYGSRPYQRQSRETDRDNTP